MRGILGAGTGSHIAESTPQTLGGPRILFGFFGGGDIVRIDLVFFFKSFMASLSKIRLETRCCWSNILFCFCLILEEDGVDLCVS
jgi:hypothetical protein